MSSSRGAVPIIVVLASAAALAAWAVSRGRAEPELVGPAPSFEFEDMMQAAEAFVASLEPEQRAKALFEFEDAERLNWHFVPVPGGACR